MIKIFVLSNEKIENFGKLKGIILKDYSLINLTYENFLNLKIFQIFNFKNFRIKFKKIIKKEYFKINNFFLKKDFENNLKKLIELDEKYFSKKIYFFKDKYLTLKKHIFENFFGFRKKKILRVIEKLELIPKESINYLKLNKILKLKKDIKQIIFKKILEEISFPKGNKSFYLFI